jgi:FKBP-type peptidyl-prolyl cis-trans isomerase
LPLDVQEASRVSRASAERGVSGPQLETPAPVKRRRSVFSLKRCFAVFVSRNVPTAMFGIVRVAFSIHTSASFKAGSSAFKSHNCTDVRFQHKPLPRAAVARRRLWRSPLVLCDQRRKDASSKAETFGSANSNESTTNADATVNLERGQSAEAANPGVPTSGGPRRRSPFEDLVDGASDGFGGPTSPGLPRRRSNLSEQNERIRALLGLEKRDTSERTQQRPAAPVPERPATTVTSTENAPGLIDLTGDGGVLRELLSRGAPEKAANKQTPVQSTSGSRLRVHYVGKLAETGQIFDASRERQEPFEFILGEGSVIKGWEAGLVGLAAGDVVRLVCAPAYAYGLRGVPPVIPPRAKLEFEVEVLEVLPAAPGNSEAQSKSSLRALDEDDVPRTPEDISRAYIKRLEERAANPKKESKWFIISPFASATGERPPWWLNPNITFLIIFSVLGLATYAVYVSGGIRQGFPPS